ncbi:unnamed protein product [Rotaria magnacalcarata]
MDSNFDHLQNNVNEVETRLDKLHEDIILKLNECSNCIKSAQQLCHQATEMVAALEKKIGNLTSAEEEWKEIKGKLAQISIQSKVILDVGGEKFITCVETLTREKNTFFTALFSSQWQLEKDPNDGSIFIDRDGKLFNHILAYLRTNKISKDILNNDSLREFLVTEAEYFHLHNFLIMLTDIYFSNGTLLKLLAHKKKLNEFYGKVNQRWDLIYKATRDGFDANAFHSRCNNKGPTMTIIQSNNNCLFGGYTTIPWTSDNSYRSDTTAFLFTLTNPHDIQPTKYMIGGGTIAYAVHHGDDRGPTFGGGHDIYLANSSNSNNSSYIGFPMAYVDTTGKGNKTFTGAFNFTAADIEVFRLV